MKLIDVLQENLIKYPLASQTKVEAIKELLDLMENNQIIQNKEEILKAVLERERIMTTGVGNGVAIPHCKTAKSPNFAIALGIHAEGIDFESLDEKPAHIIFLLIGPDSKPGTHIRLLSRISRIISKDEVRRKILDCTSPEEVYRLLQQEEANFFEIKP